MATPAHAEHETPPRRTLAMGIATGAAVGAGIAVAAAFALVFALSAVDMAGPPGRQAYVYLGLEAGFAGAVLGSAFAGLMRLRKAG